MSTNSLLYICRKNFSDLALWLRYPQSGRIYEEKEVNAILKEIYLEVATLRRELIDQKIMVRENGRYWLARPLS